MGFSGLRFGALDLGLESGKGLIGKPFSRAVGMVRKLDCMFATAIRAPLGPLLGRHVFAEILVRRMIVFRAAWPQLAI